MSTRILALVGSLRAGSYNRRLAEAAVEHAPGGIDVEIFDGLAECRSTTKTSTGRNTFRTRRWCCATAFSAPMRCCWPPRNTTAASRPRSRMPSTGLHGPLGNGVIVEKPVAVVGTSHGRYGGVWAHEDTRKTAGIAGARVLDNIALSIPHAAERFAIIHPADDYEVSAAIPEILAKLAAATEVPTKEEA